nr:MAG TPA: Internalin K rich repeat protein [Crassvirales sp.]
MGKCLVTKLNGVVDNSSILRMGEMRFYVSKVDSATDKTQGFAIKVNKPVKLEILGEGYFTNKELTNNLGKTIMIDANNPNVFVSNNDVEIAVLDKYSITNVMSYYIGATGGSSPENKKFDIDGLKYSTNLNQLVFSGSQAFGDIENLSKLTKLTILNLGKTNVEGDIKALTNLSLLTSLVLNLTKVYGNISSLAAMTALTNVDFISSQVSGDISALSKLTELTTVRMHGTNVNGNVNALSNLVKLQYFLAPNTSGDISALSMLRELKEFSSISSTIVGDLAKLPSSCYSFDASNYKGSGFTWSSRASSSNIISISGSPKIENIDKMLQDLAQCQAAIPDKTGTYNIISAIGTRTSASDAAVQTLQSKGYTVSITPA